MHHQAKTKLCIFMATVLALSLLAFFAFEHEITVGTLKEYTQSFGSFAPIIYILIFTLVPLTLIPTSLIAISGGALFGLYYGSLYTLIGAAFGATLSFGLSRYFGKTLAEKLISNKAQCFSEHAEKNGFLFVFLLRLIPFVPFDVISYGAGLSRIRYIDFLCATCIGILPGVVAYSNIGDKSSDIHSIEFYTSITILIALIAVSRTLKKLCSLKRLQELGDVR